MLRLFEHGLCRRRPGELVLRGRWESQANFIVTQITNTIGLCDVWLFPMLMRDNGGGAFLLPYLMAMTVVGIPLTAMMLALGQFTSNGPATCWEFCPLFQGVGFGFVVYSMLLSTYSNVILSWVIFYIFNSFRSPLPWAGCAKEWATDYCWDNLLPSNVSACIASGWAAEKDGACYNTNSTPKRITALWNVSEAERHGIKRVTPAREFLMRGVLRIQGGSYDLTNLGALDWPLVFCLCLNYVIIYLALVRGLRGLVKVEYVTLTYALIAIIALLVRASDLDGASEGMEAYLTLDVDKLLTPGVWCDAVAFTLYTLSLSTGSLLCLASYNVFHADIVMYAAIMAAANIAYSLMGGFIVFSSLGFVARHLDLPVSEVSTQGWSMVFEAQPYALALQPNARLWSGVFFLLIYLLGCSTEVIRIQTVVECLKDLNPSLRFHRKLVRFFACVAYFLLSLPMVTQGGVGIIKALNYHLFSFNVFLLFLAQLAAVVLFYGVRHFLVDVELMVGTHVMVYLPWTWVKYCLWACWLVVCPVIMVLGLIASVVRSRNDKGQGATDGEFILGFLSAIATVVPVPIVGIYNVWKRKGSLLEKLCSVIKPTDRWGPATFKMRKVWLNRYSGTLTADTVSDCGDSIFSLNSLEDDFHYVTAHMTSTRRSYCTAHGPTIDVKGKKPRLSQLEAGFTGGTESTGVDPPGEPPLCAGSPLSTDLQKTESCVDVIVTPSLGSPVKMGSNETTGTLSLLVEVGSDKTPGSSSLHDVAQ